MSRVLRESDFCIRENKDSVLMVAVTAQLIIAFVFTTRIVQSLFLLISKFQASSLSSPFLRLYRLVCEGTGRETL